MSDGVEQGRPDRPNEGSVSEARLIERVLAKDPVAERQLYDAHVDRVYRLAFRLTGDPDLAEECVQETFIRAFDRLGSFRGDAALSTWLHSVTVSVGLNLMRKVKRIRGRTAELDEIRSHGSFDPEPKPHLRQRLQQAVDDLPEMYRVVLVMHDMEGYTHEEIGAALDVAAGTSKARLSRARAKLREELSEYAGEWVS